MFGGRGWYIRSSYTRSDNTTNCQPNDCITNDHLSNHQLAKCIPHYISNHYLPDCSPYDTPNHKLTSHEFASHELTYKQWKWHIDGICTGELQFYLCTHGVF
ncbi:hypothetical protein CYMTET_5168 [Cymbomonas tetramitiformis]|uniref:Uncharacterized protein n=1 Tax=Cymbomonas tetramitiformis TaxID=36881 RepID=A0AAE0H002_9CHLO|nr:hypothetical protein CYMTET_5168 [Cymbomonas tetramitiformis]